MDSNCSHGNIPNTQKERAEVKKTEKTGAQRQTLCDISTEEAGRERKPGRSLQEELGGSRTRRPSRGNGDLMAQKAKENKTQANPLD